jgi:hypothetical protein
MSTDTLSPSVALEWIKVALENTAGSKFKAKQLDLAVKLQCLLESSSIMLENVRWLRVSFGDKAEAARLRYVLNFWQKVKSKGMKLGNEKLQLQIATIASGILSDTIEAKKCLWERRVTILEKDWERKKKGKKKYSDDQTKVFLSDVEELKKEFSLQHSLLLAELQEYNKYYDEHRLAVLWYVLTYEFKQQELILPIDHASSEEVGTVETPFQFDVSQEQVSSQDAREKSQILSNKRARRSQSEDPPTVFSLMNSMDELSMAMLSSNSWNTIKTNFHFPPSSYLINCAFKTPVEGSTDWSLGVYASSQWGARRFPDTRLQPTAWAHPVSNVSSQGKWINQPLDAIPIEWQKALSSPKEWLVYMPVLSDGMWDARCDCIYYFRISERGNAYFPNTKEVAMYPTPNWSA